MAAYRVLVVEDNHEVRRMVSSSIKTLGAEIDVLDVPSAEEALFISSSLPLDLVILDIRLPGMSGIDMVGKLRKRRPETKIILVTGVEDTGIRQQVAEAGTDAYFFKPIDIDKFLEAVKHCLWTDQAEPVPPPIILESAVSLVPPQSVVSSQAVSADRDSTPSPGIGPTIDERLMTLKQQLRAVSVLLVNPAGKVVEVAGNPIPITSNPAILSALMHAFETSLQVSQALGRNISASLHYFATQRQSLYAAPVGSSYALFAISAGFFEPDKLPAIDHCFQSAVHDIQAIMANVTAEEQARKAALEKLQEQPPAEAVIDPQTLESVDNMFAEAATTTSREGADSFWDSAGKSDSPGNSHNKEILSYDQARDLGLAPGEEGQA